MTAARILFPVDFSQRCIEATPYVREMAGRFNSKVLVMHAAQLEQFAATIEPYLNIELAIAARSSELQAMLDKFVTEHLPGVAARSILKVGEPAALITRTAHERDLDLIMMPSHGYGPFRSLLLGSITAKVLHDARCPVLDESTCRDV